MTNGVSEIRAVQRIEMKIGDALGYEVHNLFGRHSGCNRAEVTLNQTNTSVLITVRDWGVGFDLKSVTKGHYGLTGMRERARLLGGKADIDSTPGEGTTVKVELPFAEAFGGKA